MNGRTSATEARYCLAKAESIFQLYGDIFKDAIAKASFDYGIRCFSRCGGNAKQRRTRRRKLLQYCKSISW